MRSPASLLNSVDFPTFGRPTTATTGLLIAFLSSCDLKIEQGRFIFPCSPRAPCAALAADFLCMLLLIKKQAGTTLLDFTIIRGTCKVHLYLFIRIRAKIQLIGTLNDLFSYQRLNQVLTVLPKIQIQVFAGFIIHFRSGFHTA